MLAAGSDAEADAVFRDDFRRRRFRRPTVERLLFLNVLLGEPVETGVGVVNRQSRLDGVAKAVHAGGEKLQHDDRAEAVHHETAQSVAFGMDEAIGVGHGVEAEPAAAQLDGPAEAMREKGVVDRLVTIGGEDAEGDARMAVVEAAADPLAVAVDHVHDAAGRDAHGRLLDHFLKDPRMRRPPGDFEPHLRKDGGKFNNVGATHNGMLG